MEDNNNKSMKYLLFLILLQISTCGDDETNIIFAKEQDIQRSNVYYVSSTGSDSNPGTMVAPWKSWGKGFSTIVAGDILYIRGGVYTQMQGTVSGNLCGAGVSGKSGTSANRITVSAYPGDSRPILDCSALSSQAGYHRGIIMSNASYWDFYGLIIKNVREYSSSPTSYTGSAWEIQSSSNINIEYCDVTYCLNGFSLTGVITNLNYINCDAYENWDIYQSGDLCNGFNGNVGKGSSITYTGCRAWLNSDDGYDNMAGGGYMTYINCWAFNNRPWHGGDASGNGDGFKLGFSDKGYEAGVQRTMYNCISAYNGLMGFDESADQACNMAMVLYNCVSYNNADYYSYRFNSSYNTGIVTLRNNISIGANNLYAGRSTNIQDHNSWNGGVTANASDFVSVDMNQLKAARKSDGSLPDITAFHLVAGSDLIDKGVNVGLLFNGSAPDMGAFEYGTDPQHSTLGKLIKSNGKLIVK